jgi:acetoin:2,6-dichlorophenolindophenol oxidoreductase subunit alpha
MTRPHEFEGEEGRALAIELLRRMLLIRRFEEATIELHAAGELPGAVHLSIGQEAAIVGACMATNRSDYMTGTHRSHGHPIAKGAHVDALMAELLGKATGVCGGKGGSMHLADFSVGSLGESGIVGSALPVATGAAFASSVIGDGRVVLCFFGDGAANEGVFHESLNLAALWGLPVVFFCENNEYAVTVHASDATSIADVAARGAAYGLTGEVVDGQDVLACYRVTRAAVTRARNGQGPSLIEAKTHRFTEHAYGLRLSNPYRDEEDVRRLGATRDPISLFAAELVGWELLDDGLREALEAEVADIVAGAVEFARASAYPAPEAAHADVYV